MSAIFITRILMFFYGIGCLLMFIRIIGLVIAGQKIRMGDVSNVLLFPIVILTRTGRVELRATLTEGKTK